MSSCSSCLPVTISKCSQGPVKPANACLGNQIDLKPGKNIPPFLCQSESASVVSVGPGRRRTDLAVIAARGLLVRPKHCRGSNNQVLLGIVNRPARSVSKSNMVNNFTVLTISTSSSHFDPLPTYVQSRSEWDPELMCVVTFPPSSFISG